ncbi:MAG TPA: FAD binding domain-containing protein [Dermatophilaceae bacterium]|nr:FAD binding domain-containing protein [Dermatophilaceae bacterium]
MEPELLLDGRTVPLTLPPEASLLDAIRHAGVTGPKEGCAEGECGACAVLVCRPRADGASGSEWVAVNACLPPALGYAGQQVCTPEGLGRPGALHPVQEALASAGGSQCGYCTPGFVTSMAAEFYRRSGAADAEFDIEAMSGNLCRCTGYRPIVDAAHSLGAPADDDALVRRLAEPAPAPVPVDVRTGERRFVRPASLDDAVALLAEHPDAVLVAGATDLGVQVNLAMHRPPLLVVIDRLAELRELDVDLAEGGAGVRIGAALSLTEVQTRLAGRVPLLDQLFPQFASRLIRNAATIGGNLGTGSPIGDSPPALLALDAIVELAGPEGRREVPLDGYFTGYRTTVRRPGELIVAVRFPAPVAGVTAFHKVAKRRLDDISSVAVAMVVAVRDGVVAHARIGLGGVAAIPMRAKATEDFLLGKPWDATTVDTASEVLAGEGTPMSDHRASAAYRQAMLRTALPRLVNAQERER